MTLLEKRSDAVTTSLLMILFLAAGVSYQEPAKAPAWTTLIPREGDFRIDFPTRPQEQTKPIPSAAGTIEQKIYYTRAGGCLFTMQRYRYPRPFRILELADRLAEQKKGYLQGQVELVRENKVTVDDVTGEQFEYKGRSPRANGTVTSLTRHFINGSSYYMMTVMSAPNQPLPPDADRFLDSFHFATTDAARAGTTPKAGAMTKAGASPKGHPGAVAKAPEGGARSRLKDDTPEDALRSFMVAAVNQDEAALRAITLPDRELVWLLRGQPPPAEVVEKMRTSAAELKFKRLKPGDQIKVPPRGQVAVLGPEEVTEDRAVLLPEGSPFPIRVERIEGHWKVEARPIIAARKAAAAEQQKGKE
jgi:hypothetical protein